MPFLILQFHLNGEQSIVQEKKLDHSNTFSCFLMKFWRVLCFDAWTKLKENNHFIDIGSTQPRNAQNKKKKPCYRIYSTTRKHRQLTIATDISCSVQENPWMHKRTAQPMMMNKIQSDLFALSTDWHRFMNIFIENSLHLWWKFPYAQNIQLLWFSIEQKKTNNLSVQHKIHPLCVFWYCLIE